MATVKTIHEYHMEVQKRIVEEMAALLEDTEYNELERIAGAKCYADCLYWLTLAEEDTLC